MSIFMEETKMKKFFAIALAIGMIFALYTVSAAADYPDSTFTLISDAKAGSDVDTICRKFATVAENIQIVPGLLKILRAEAVLWRFRA